MLCINLASKLVHNGIYETLLGSLEGLRVFFINFDQKLISDFERECLDLLTSKFTEIQELFMKIFQFISCRMSYFEYFFSEIIQNIFQPANQRGRI